MESLGYKPGVVQLGHTEVQRRQGLGCGGRRVENGIGQNLVCVNEILKRDMFYPKRLLESSDPITLGIEVSLV